MKSNCFAIVMGVVMTGSAIAQASPDTVDPGTDKVVVTGSRQSRSAGKTMSPVDVISAADLQKSGAVDLATALNEILPAYNMPAISGYDQSAIVRPAGLRGLNGDETLVLVNGKRRHMSAIVNVNAYADRGSEPADLNLIPFSMVDHIEILRDGAAAQYGSDAIAGVINIILKRDDEGGEAHAQLGGYGWKDGLTTQAGINKGLKLGRDGFFDIAFDFNSQNKTDRSGATPGPFYYPVVTPTGDVSDPREATTSTNKVSDGLPFARNYSAGYNMELPVSSAVTLYSFSTYSFRHAKGYEYFRYANDGAKDPTYNYNVNTGTSDQIYPDGYEPNEVIDENDFQATGGAKGRDPWLGWNWDIASTYGKDDDSVSVVNTMNATLGPTSPHAFYAGSWIATQLTNTLDLTHDYDIGLAAPLNVALGGEYRNDSYALKPGEPGSYENGPYGTTGIDGPNPSYDPTLPVSPTNSPTVTSFPTPGAQSFPGFDPSIASSTYRDTFAGYVDFETKPIKRWDVGVAGRFEHYSDFGATRTGKLSTRFEIIPQLAARATLSNGFRAPGLGQGHYAATTTNFDNGVAFQVGTFPTSSPIAQSLGATALQPEKSTNISAGLVANPVKNFEVTLDAYRIYLRHRVTEVGPIGVAAYPNAEAYIVSQLVAAGLTPLAAEGTSVQYFTNAASTRTQGLDLAGSYKLDLHEFGRLVFSAEGTWAQTTLTSQGGIPAALQPVAAATPGFQLIDVSTQGFLTQSTPQNKLILGMQYRYKKLDVDLHEIRFGHVVDTSNLVFDGPTTTVPPTWITNLDISYKVLRPLTLGLGADNLFNHYPPQTSADFQSFVGEGFGKYDALTPYGYFGGFYYARVGYSF